MGQKISAVIITFNEEQRIRATLQQLQWCDEILIVDSGSTDRTLSICEEMNARVLYRRFDGYGQQKNWAVQQATNDWILSVDADEVLTDELCHEIRDLVSNQPSADAYYIPRNFSFMNHIMRFGGEYKQYYIRLFNRQKTNFSLHTVHEYVEPTQKTGKLKNPMIHYSYKNIHDYFEKFNKYTTLAAQEMYAKKKKVSFLYLIVRIIISWFQLYFLKGLIFDGIPGFVWATLSSWYPFVKYLKLYEMNHYNK